MLCLADRFFPSYKLWHAAAKTGADLLWRTRRNSILEPDRYLPDGSYLSRIYAPTSDRRKDRHTIAMPSWCEGSTITWTIHPRPICFIG
jgi:hypothetical protein